MGWARSFLLGHVGQQLDIEELRSQLAVHRMRTVRRQAMSLKAMGKQVESLQIECDNLKLYLAALIRLLVENDLCTKEELEAIVDKIDGEDGQVDGVGKDVLPARNARRARAEPESVVPGATPCVPTKGVRLRPKHRR